jgi:selenocysteine-specific elongation factor
MKHIVLGTAGHIDHGKTRLTMALTGVDTDKLKEEKNRGITIELGFAPMTLSDGNKISIVDVPGHERFVKTMMAGASGIDAVLLVIAADDGLMPQTREHLDIIRLLRVQKGILVLTKCDLVDKERIAEVKGQVKELVAGSCLENAPICEVSAVSGAGIDQLKVEIETLVSQLKERNGKKPVRLSADRAFPVSGFGTVVTGTLTEGDLHVGDSVEIYPQKELCQVRSLQNHNKNEEMAFAGSRTAMSFSGLKKDVLAKGSTIAEPDSMIMTDLLTVFLQITPDSKYQIKNSSQLHFFHGTDEVVAKLRLLDSDKLLPGQSGYAQLKLSKEIAVRLDDRFILRFFSPVITIGGGQILSCNGKRLRRHYRPVLEKLEKLNSTDLAEKLEVRIEEAGILPISRHLLRIRANQSEEEYAPAEEKLLQSGKILEITEGKLISTAVIADRFEKVTELLQRFHDTYQLQPGMKLAEWRKRFFPEENAPCDELLQLWCKDGSLKYEKGYVSLPDFQPEFTQQHKIMQRKLLHYYKDAWLCSPDQKLVDKKFEKRGPIYKQIHINMRMNGLLIGLSPRYYVHHEAYEDALRIFRKLCARQGGKASLAEFRTEANISRKYSQLFLEYWDKHGISRRIGDEHILIKKKSPEDEFYISEIPDDIFALMQGRSYKENCTIPRGELRYLHLLHKTLDGESKEGEMIVNRRIAENVLEIFKELYQADYPIEKVRLIDHYDADDESSMQDNNSSAFNFRCISYTNIVSKHGLGLAVDINPLYNPYIKKVNRETSIEPATGKDYCDRSKDFPYKIDHEDLAFQLFSQHGFEWGGDWENRKDYQHFEFPVS